MKNGCLISVLVVCGVFAVIIANAPKIKQSKVDKAIPETSNSAAAVDELSEAFVATACDEAVRSTMRAKSTFDTAWSWQYLKHPEKGRVTLIRDFEAQNAFGGIISSQYRCLVQTEPFGLVELAIRQNGRWDILYAK